MGRRKVAVFVAALFAALCIAAAPAPIKKPKESDRLVVYGDTFMFGVKVPKGWSEDIENAPKISAGVVFYPAKETFAKHTRSIAICVSKKVDENTAADLAHDTDERTTLYPDIQTADLLISHPLYTTQSRLFYFEKKTYDYVTYVNPGKSSPLLFTVVMNTTGGKASSADLKAYKQIVRTFELVESK